MRRSLLPGRRCRAIRRRQDEQHAQARRLDDRALIRLAARVVIEQDDERFVDRPLPQQPLLVTILDDYNKDNNRTERTHPQPDQPTSYG
jgi:hypothetical protein